MAKAPPIGAARPHAHIQRLLRLALDAAQSRRSIRPPGESPIEGAKRRPPARGCCERAASTRSSRCLAGWFLCRAGHPAAILPVVWRQARASPCAAVEWCGCEGLRRFRLPEKRALISATPRVRPRIVRTPARARTVAAITRCKAQDPRGGDEQSVAMQAPGAVLTILWLTGTSAELFLVQIRPCYPLFRVNLDHRRI